MFCRINGEWYEGIISSLQAYMGWKRIADWLELCGCCDDAGVEDQACGWNYLATRRPPIASRFT